MAKRRKPIRNRYREAARYALTEPQGPCFEFPARWLMALLSVRREPAPGVTCKAVLGAVASVPPGDLDRLRWFRVDAEALGRDLDMPAGHILTALSLMVELDLWEPFSNGYRVTDREQQEVWGNVVARPAGLGR
jgi:hypothetical protein